MLTPHQRIRLGTIFIEHRHTLWPHGGAATPDEIRLHLDTMIDALQQMHATVGERLFFGRLAWLRPVLAELGANDNAEG